MNRMLRSGLSIFVLLLLAGAAMAQTGSVDTQPAADPTTTSAELSTAASSDPAPTTAPESQATPSTPSPGEEPATEPLPQTASSLPLIAAVGLLVLGTAVSLSYLRQRGVRSRG
jgi:hypothetical protein